MAKTHIVLMAGGTGGHIFPALAVAHKFLEQGYSVSWLGSKNSMEARIVPKHHIDIDYIPIQNVRGKGLLRWALLPLRLTKAVLLARRILKKRQASLVIGMGGFVSGPGAIAAKTLGIPLVIHEQNALAGMTNRHLAKFAKVVLCGFPNAFAPQIQAHYVGNPVRADLLRLNALPIETPHQPLHILVMGGSQGARIFNEVIPKTLALLPPGSVELWQQSGEKLHEEALNHFANANVSAKITPFIDNMSEAFTWADLIICRAGALTVSELAVTKKPAILIPLPTAVDDHQRLNAEFLTEHQAGILILQKNYCPEKLTEILLNFINEPYKLEAMAAQAGALARLDATDKILAHCVALLSAS